ncbi:hypothetical protein CB1_085562006 [Camelus ferus]|nr:hypothetical protein CB1_085562006 [Camelus ferus]
MAIFSHPISLQHHPPLGKSSVNWANSQEKETHRDEPHFSHQPGSLKEPGKAGRWNEERPGMTATHQRSEACQNHTNQDLCFRGPKPPDDNRKTWRRFDAPTPKSSNSEDDLPEDYPVVKNMLHRLTVAF